MPERKKVFVPASFLHPDAEAQFAAAADEIEVVYGLPEGQRDIFGIPPAEQARLKEQVLASLDELLPELHGVMAMGPGGHVWITREMIERAASLEVIFVPGAGTENVDLEAATEHGVAVVNSAGSNMASVSDHAFGLILAAARRISINDRYHHVEKRWLSIPDLTREWGSPFQISRRTIGIVGFGFIGREVARKAKLGFEMRVLAYDPFFDPLEADRQGVELVADLAELLPQCDVVTVHAALTPSARHIIGERELRLMKESAVLVNCSRGGTVDPDALERALRERWIAAAGIDVTEPEPLPDGHPLFDLDNCIITSHSASSDPEVLSRLAGIVAGEALRALRGDRPWRLCNPAVWPAFLQRRAKAAELAAQGA